MGISKKLLAVNKALYLFIWNAWKTFLTLTSQGNLLATRIKWFQNVHLLLFHLYGNSI